MRFKRLYAFLAFALLTWNIGHIHAQEAVATMSQVLSFGSTGKVTAVDKVGTTTAISDYAGNKGNVKPASSAVVVMAGTKIETGPEAATSLSLGSAGTARLRGDSGLRVPETDEKGHSLELLKGQLFMNINADELKKHAAVEFRLKTPIALLAVKGTKFFAESNAGTDNIGVHEGSVTVQASSSGKSLVLTAGNVLTVGPGGLGEVRALSDGEKGYTTEYAIAKLQRRPLALVLHRPAQKLPAIIYKNGQSFTAARFNIDNDHAMLPADLGSFLDYHGYDPIRFTGDGIVQYHLLRANSSSKTETSFHYTTDLHWTDTRKDKVLAIRCQLRANQGIRGEVFGSAGARTLFHLSQGEQWTELIWPQAASSGRTQIDFRFTLLKTVEKTPQSTVEMRDFELLLLPK